MSTSISKLNLVQGNVALRGNGRTFNSSIGGNEKFSHQLSLALHRKQNPADALLFLADLGSKIDLRNMKPRDQMRWKELFGELAPSPILKIVL